jgi:hypothetical protein
MQRVPRFGTAGMLVEEEGKKSEERGQSLIPEAP